MPAVHTRREHVIVLEPAPLNQVRIDVPDDDGWHYVKGQLFNTSHERIVAGVRVGFEEGAAGTAVAEVEVCVGRLEAYLPGERRVRMEGRERLPIAVRFRGTMPGATLTPQVVALPVGRWS